MKKGILFGILVLIVLIGVAFVFDQNKKQKELASINTFEECAKVYPVMESYPGRCMTPDGRSFTQDIGNELEFTDSILVSNPRPNQTINNPLEIVGRARGTWFFEANFSAELFDENNKSLGVAIIQAEGEWMTEDFVSFKGILEFTKPETKKGRLVIRNANPSGLPENQKELIMPVNF